MASNVTTIAYRDATAADAGLMARIGPESFTETFGHLYTPENLAAFLINHSEANWRGELEDPLFSVRIAEENGTAVGFAKVGPSSLPFEVEGPTAELRQLYVLKPWQGAGVAPALMAWVLDEARRRGAAQLFLSVFTDNHRARAFYARYGFEAVGTYAFMVGTHADEDIIMRLAL
ncbi:MAG TPA: GNAT family N-acetyltransferase [Allosphingosinicella sp.]|jgi:GNAT superfamily N-acetyltransferase|nr:GNAT family N-acetyltransferase [Allosphingosinicella sp.]